MELRIQNMSCEGCSRSVTKAIQGVDANASVVADLAARLVKVETTADHASVRQALADAGYPAIAADGR